MHVSHCSCCTMTHLHPTLPTHYGSTSAVFNHHSLNSSCTRFGTNSALQPLQLRNHSCTHNKRPVPTFTPAAPTFGALCQPFAAAHRCLLGGGHRQALLIQLAAQPLQVKLWGLRRETVLAGGIGGREDRQGGRAGGGYSNQGGRQRRQQQAGGNRRVLLVLLLDPSAASRCREAPEGFEAAHPSKRTAPPWAAPRPPRPGLSPTACGPWWGTDNFTENSGILALQLAQWLRHPRSGPSWRRLNGPMT